MGRRIEISGEIMICEHALQRCSAHALHDAGFLGSEDTDGDNKWIRIFWGREHVGPADRDQWRDHDL